MDMVSVIMSIYNETVAEALESIFSIQNQTYTNIEIIIIVDNPTRYDIIDAIQQNKDPRVRLEINKENIGLARSMNYAASIARGPYLARMDADDIAYPDRIMKEMLYIKASKADYVCTWYELIDGNGVKMKQQKRMFGNSVVNELLPYCNTICHPTVLIKRKTFEQLGGYRDFPCAQDYDLWLRLKDLGYRAGVIEEILLSYRVRTNSISLTKSVQQFYTLEYIRKLSKERRKYTKDSYNIINYQNYLDKNHVFSKEKHIQREKEQMLRQKYGRLCYIFLMFRSDMIRKMVFNGVCYRLIEQRTLQKMKWRRRNVS